MSSIAIRAEELTKQYRIGVRARSVYTLRAYLRMLAAAPWEYLRRTLGPPATDEILLALNGVSFEVEKGEVLGIIGPNGAGKSTLLKILSRITEPTAGRAVLKGRVSSLLEVGTGFHKELSGRDNVYLNGAILGMTRQEIESRFDEIVEFSGLEKFMETPVKRYSTGMFMRLAFAVAAHLETEIMLIDEVLAVGDAAFRKKCLGKMEDVARTGRTVLFVSHNMAVVRELCHRCMWIDHGRIMHLGPTVEVIQLYLRTLDESKSTGRWSFPDHSGKDFQIREARILDIHGEATPRHDCDQPVTIELLGVLRRPVDKLKGSLEISRTDGTTVLVSDSFDTQYNSLDALLAGKCAIRITLPPRTLGPGEYRVHLRFTCKGLNEVDSPGIIGTFQLDDHRTQRGNARPGFLQHHPALEDSQPSPGDRFRRREPRDRRRMKRSRP